MCLVRLVSPFGVMAKTPLFWEVEVQAGAFIRRKPSLLGTEWDVLESQCESRSLVVSGLRVHQARESVAERSLLAAEAVEADSVEEFGLTEVPESRECGCETGAGNADE